MLRRITKKLTEYILFPLAFFLSGLLFLYLVLSPFVNFTLTAWSLFSSDSNTLYGEEINKDIFGENKLVGYEETVPSRLIAHPSHGTKSAETTITAENTVYVCPRFFGDSKSILRKGVGQYMGSNFPGEGKAIIVSGHNNSYFNALQYLDVGETVTLETNYGTFIYEVTETAIKPNTDKSALRLGSEEETLVMYTCYPFDQRGRKSKRYYVYTKLVSGPRVLLDK